MRLTILGSSASQPRRGDACSGYLVSEGDTHVLLDCGSGTLGRLQEHIDIDDLAAVFVSHLHPDHFIDLVAMRYGRRYGAPGAREIPVYVPPGGIEYLTRLGAAISKTQPFWDGALCLEEYEPQRAYNLGSASVTPHEVEHGIRSFGMRVEAAGRVLAYTSDTVWCEGLAGLSAGADVVLAESTLGGGAPDHDPRTHLTSAEAGRVAGAAGAEMLVLTHFWPTADRDQACFEAASTFHGRIVAAEPGLQLSI
jgi:ribonuclease BN (tRNA processing enzyme)